MSAGAELVERALRRLPDDDPGADGPEWQAAEDEVAAARLVSSMLTAYRPELVLEALTIAYRLLRGCGSPAAAAGRLRQWREERMGSDRRLTEAELGALSVAATIAGVEP